MIKSVFAKKNVFKSPQKTPKPPQKTPKNKKKKTKQKLVSENLNTSNKFIIFEK